jgi:hypothetical protein
MGSIPPRPLSLTQSAGFALIALGAALVFRGQA